MTKEEFKLLKRDIRETQLANLEAQIMMLKEYLILFINILINKGFSDNYLQELIKIKNEYIAILTEENNLLNLILKNGINKDLYAVDILFEKINELADKTINYYYDLLDDIEKEIEIDRGFSYIRLPKNFNTLIEDNELKLLAYGLDLTLEDIKNYLCYENDFWDYIANKIKVIKKPYQDFNLKMHYYGVWYNFNENNELTKLIICIPEIVDLKTAQIAIHEFRHAHDIYTGSIKEDTILEEIAKHEEEEFKKQMSKKML